MPDVEFVVHPEGELDIATTPAVQAEWLGVIGAFQPDLLVIDLGAVTFLDSSALSAILLAHKRQQLHGGEVVVINASPRLTRVFRVTGLDAVIDITEHDGHQDGRRDRPGHEHADHRRRPQPG
jgi:anti-sigma B factor antagonist